MTSQIGKEEGFTLIEVVIVVVVISLATAMILPSFGLYSETMDQRSFERRVINVFRHVREKAVLDGKKQVVKIEGGNLEYDGGYFQVINDKIIGVYSNYEEIEFYSDGSTSGIYLEIFTEGDRKIVLEVEKVTGKVKLGE